MRSARGISDLPPLRLTLSLLLVVATISIAMPGLFAMFGSAVYVAIELGRDGRRVRAR